MKRIFGRRRARIEASEQALAKSARLGQYIEKQLHPEAQELGEWARDRLRKNHLSELFYDVHGRAT